MNARRRIPLQMAPTLSRLLLVPNRLRCLRCLVGLQSGTLEVVCPPCANALALHGLSGTVDAAHLEPRILEAWWPERPWPHPPAANRDGYLELWLENELVPFLRDNPRWLEALPESIARLLPSRFQEGRFS